MRTPLFHLLAIGCMALVTSLAATAQDTAEQPPVPQTQNEAAAGGRTFPIGTLRGRFKVVQPPAVELDGQPARLSPGARIYNEQRMMVMSGAIVGQEFAVNYKRDGLGNVTAVWILTPQEAAAERESAQKPFFNFWPFK